jgi:23S rRNA G2445 N2-methylase RlmL
MDRDKELYKQLRVLPWEKLWREEVPRFNTASQRERLEHVAVVRAVGVVFAESGLREQLVEVKTWLRSLLRDPQEKVRRYAAAALPKIGADLEDERELLALTKTASGERERKHVVKALSKIGGKETLESEIDLPGRAAQRIKAKVARAESPSVIRLDARFDQFRNIDIHLRCRSGLEQFVIEEVERTKQFRVRQKLRGLLIIEAPGPFTIADILTMRCFDSVAFSVKAQGDPTTVATSPHALEVFKTFTDGPIRYRIDFLDKGHQRAAVAKLAEQIHARRPELINGGGDTPWTLEIRGKHITFAPKILPDPRFAYRRGDVPAASHPPLAACIAQLAGVVKDDVIWDPFCGSGVELVERWRLGGVRQVIGADLDAKAIEIARSNLTAAGIEATHVQLVTSDFRNFDPGRVSLIITNPPMGRRVPIPNLQGLIDDLFRTAARVLHPEGRLVFANPVGATPSSRLFRREFSQLIDMGGFHCRLEKYTLATLQKY